MNSFSTAWKNVLRQASRQPLRVLLVLLQLVLGVLVVTVVLHVFEAEKSQRYGRDVFSIGVTSPGQSLVAVQTPFTADVLVELQELAPDVAGLALHAFHLYRPQLDTERERFVLPVVGRVSANFPDVLGIELIQGTGFTQQEVADHQAVMLLHEEVAELVFAGLDPIGQELVLSSFIEDAAEPTAYEVIGVYRYPSGFSGKPRGAFFEHSALIPAAASGSNELVVLSAPGRGEEARQQILAAARRTFPVLLGRDGVDVFVEESDRPFNAFLPVEPNQLLFGLIGITALILALVGIFSGTIVDVAERTHEIGVRRALGASAWHIGRDFMHSALLLALLAGVIGFSLAGFIVPLLDSRLGETLFPGIAIAFKPTLGLLSVLFIALLSAVLGLIPAWGAGRLAPIAALSEA